jgi:transposase-like protein
MKPSFCVYCELKLIDGSKFVRHGRYYRTSDSTWVQRYRCTGCKKLTSTATYELTYRQKKRQKNHEVVGLLASGVSLRRAALLARLNRKTPVRMLKIESARAKIAFTRLNEEAPKAKVIEFDDLETFEHTKCKPLSVTLAVEFKTRRILGLEVSRMSSNGKLAAKSRALYGTRKDERRLGRRRLLSSLKGLVAEDALIKSDQNPYYVRDVKRYFPKATHQRFKGRRGSSTGQGELKKGKFDPLFSLNHTCAMLRANVNRLFRKTWCTTKRADRLYAHLILYAHFHNTMLIKQPA